MPLGLPVPPRLPTLREGSADSFVHAVRRKVSVSTLITGLSLTVSRQGPQTSTPPSAVPDTTNLSSFPPSLLLFTTLLPSFSTHHFTTFYIGLLPAPTPSQ